MIEERIGAATKTCVGVIYRNPNIFPISKITRGYAADSLKLSGNDFEFYCTYTLQTRFGLVDTIRKYMTNTKHLNYVLPDKHLGLLNMIYECNTAAILMNYAEIENAHDQKSFDLMLKQEGLIKR